jgi:hypothetical protein
MARRQMQRQRTGDGRLSYSAFSRYKGQLCHSAIVCGKGRQKKFFAAAKKAKPLPRITRDSTGLAQIKRVLENQRLRPQSVPSVKISGKVFLPRALCAFAVKGSGFLVLVLVLANY